MSDFKLKFTLKQHTPMIHFQSEQIGATLRATELKPKLDRFLIEHVFDDDFEKYKEFLIAGQDKAFDYKVKITDDCSTEKIIEDRNPLFFANMGKSENEKIKQKYAENNFPKISFHSFNTTIIKRIDDNFEAFLANTNFGTRQSKGFGSFYLVDKETKEPVPFNEKLVKYKVYHFESTKNDYENDIRVFYSFLRAGINAVDRDRNTRFYVKAAIFSYSKSLGITWDKRSIKSKYLNNNATKHPMDNEKLVRDLFGLSSEQKWGRDGTITKEHSNIERFKSPITFKPIINNNKVTVYFWADNSVQDILNEEFLIKMNGRGDLTLSTPKIFSFDDFFIHTFRINLATFIDSKFHRQPEYTKLLNILTKLGGQI